MLSFFTAYVQAALCTPDGGGTPLNLNWKASDIDNETIAQMKQDCERFQRENSVDLAFIGNHAGETFWLVRNGYDTGPKIPGTRAQRLTDAAKAFGPYTLHVGTGAKLHGEQG